MPGNILGVGDKVSYAGKDGAVDAMVIKVHYDDHPPYYTIKMAGVATERCAVTVDLARAVPAWG